jgi:flagellar hook-basal body complex protein FliE
VKPCRAAIFGLLCAICSVTIQRAKLLSSRCVSTQIFVGQLQGQLQESPMTDRVDINRLLGEMRSIKSQTQVFQRPQAVVNGDVAINRGLNNLQVESPNKVPSFGDLMTKAINNVNDVQQKSSSMAEAYEKGVAGVDITDVMIASQKASVSFQAMVQVRNKLVEAYKDVMSMPI